MSFRKPFVPKHEVLGVPPEKHFTLTKTEKERLIGRRVVAARRIVKHGTEEYLDWIPKEAPRSGVVIGFKVLRAGPRDLNSRMKSRVICEKKIEVVVISPKVTNVEKFFAKAEDLFLAPVELRLSHTGLKSRRPDDIFDVWPHEEIPTGYHLPENAHRWRRGWKKEWQKKKREVSP